MRLLAAADLHLGEPFYSEDLFLDLLKWVSTQGDNLDIFLFNGDILDFKVVKPFELFTKALRTLDAMRALATDKVYITGNHDEELSLFDKWVFDTINMCKVYDLTDMGKRIRFLHGHQYDAEWHKLKPIAIALVRAQVWIAKLFGVDIYPLALSLSSYFTQKAYPKMVAKIVEKAIEDNQDCDCVVLGHVHSLYKNEDSHPKVVCVPDFLRHHAFIELTGGQISIFSYQGGGKTTLLQRLSYV